MGRNKGDVRKTFMFEGKRYEVTGKTEKEVYEKIALKKRDLEEGRVVLIKNTLVRDWAKEWIEIYKKDSVSVGWCKNIISILKGCIIPKIGAYTIRQVKPIHIQGILNEKKGYSKSYLRKIYNICDEMFEDAKRNGMILSNPCDGLALPITKENQKRRSITDYERTMILRTCEEFKGGLFYKIMLYCGLRPGEVAALQWRHINFKTGKVHVEQALKRDDSIGPPKSTSGDRRIPIPDVLLPELFDKKSSPYIFVCEKPTGGHHTQSSLKRMWESFWRHLNIEMGCKTFRNEVIPPYRVADDLTPYCLRHTYCTDLQAAGVPINVAKEWMGHSDISITASIYTHQSDEADKNAADLLNNFIARCGTECGTISING